MSNPSFDNIDKWLFEYAEGNLNDNQKAQLELFILQNPALEQELDAWENAKIDATPSFFPNIDAYTRKPFAWMLPSSIFGATVLAISLASFNFYEPYVEMNFADSVHAIQLNANQPTHQKTKTYFSKKINNTPNLASLNVFGGGIWTFNNLLTTIIDNPTCGGVRYTNEFPWNNMAYNFGELEKGVDFIESDNLKDKNQLKTSEIIESKSEKSNSLESALWNAKVMSRTQTKSGSAFNKTLYLKIKSLTRKIIRMTDNPISLTNSKDIYYHTPGKQALDVNFGSTGSLLTPRLQTLSRAQWTGHGNQQFSNQISFDTYAKNIRGGIGVQVQHQYYGNGAFQAGQFSMTYSPKFAVSKNVVIEPAIRFKMGNKRLYNQKLVPGQLIELDRRRVQTFSGQSETSAFQDLWYKDLGFALMSNTKWFSAGIQIDNIGRHFSNVFDFSDGQNNAAQQLTATIGTDYVSRTKLFSFSPYIMYQKMENLSEIWGGSNFRYKKIIFGGGISSLGDYAGSIGIKTNRFMMTYSVDYTHSVLLKEKLFSQQLTLRLLTNRGYNDRRMLK